MSPGNAADMEKLTELEATGKTQHSTGKETPQGYKLGEHNSLTINYVHYSESNSNLLDLKTQYLKIRQQDTELRQHIGFLEAELAEAQAQLKESMSDNPKAQPFPRSLTKNSIGNRGLNPVSVCKALSYAKSSVIVPQSRTKTLQLQKSELSKLTKKSYSGEMKTCLSKKTASKTEIRNIFENLKLPDIKSHLRMPSFENCSRIPKSCKVVRFALEKKDNTSNKEYVSLSNSVEKNKLMKVADSEINISQKSSFLPPISKQQHKVDNQEKMISKSNELKLPDMYAPTRAIFKSCPNTHSEEETRKEQFKYQVPFPN